MTRVDTDKYSVLIRSDYLYALSRLSQNRQERDKIIQEAVEGFLKDYPLETRLDEIRTEGPRCRISYPETHQPTYHMYLEFVRLPDHLVELMDIANRYPGTNRAYGSLGHVLNAAIRVFLNKNHPEFLAKPVRENIQSDITDHA
jgi:hypothetical protein